MDKAQARGGNLQTDSDEGSKQFLIWQLSQLEFNWRVLAQARDLTLPILERLKF